MKRKSVASTKKAPAKKARASAPNSKGPVQRSLITRAPRLSVFPAVGFPAQLRMKHRYATNLVMTSTTGSLASQLFSCNGMYDPDVSGVGHQPMYFDTLSAIYNHYTVLASTIKITVTCSTVPTNPCQMVVYLEDDTTITPANTIAAQEAGTSLTKIIPAGSTNVYKMTKSWNSVMFGPDAVDNDNLQGSIAANPTEQTLYAVLWSGINSQTQACTVNFEIVYDAVWKELKSLDTQ